MTSKDRRFLLAIGLTLLATTALYFVGGWLLSQGVAWLYHSDALGERVFSQRSTIPLDAYRAEFVEFWQQLALVAGILALALEWMMWDHDGDTFSRQALGWPAITWQTLGLLGTAILTLLASRGQLPYLIPLLTGLTTLFANRAQNPFRHFGQIMNWLLQPKVSLPLVFLLAVITFFIKFPPDTLDQLVFFDDYPTIYTITLKGWELLKQGGIFGWDSRLMGGYYTVSDVSHNEIFFMLPFLPFGERVGFHLMIMFFYLTIPFLIYWLAKLRFKRDRSATLALWIGLFVAFGFFDNLLFWGMVNSVIGLNLMILNLILFTLMRQHKPLANFALILTVPLTLYAAGGFFVYSLLLIGIDFLWHWDKRMIPRLAFVMFAAFLISLTYAHTLLQYPDYFIQSDEIYAPETYTIEQIVTQSVQALSLHTDPNFWLLGRPIRYQGLFIVLLPIILTVILRWLIGLRQRDGQAEINSAMIEFVLMATLVMLMSLIVSPSVDMFVSRVRFVIPVLLAFVLAAWLDQPKRLHPAPLLLVLAILLTTLPSRLLEPIPHIPSLRGYNAALLDQIEALDSKTVLLESMGAYNLATEGAGVTQVHKDLVHMESLFPFETSKNYMSNNQEGYHHSVYRRNFVTGGAFRGKLLPDWPREMFNGFLEQWGIKHLVLWSDISRDYVDGDPAMTLRWSDGDWAIYEYANATPGDAVLPQGTATIQVNGYFEHEVALQNARRGDLVRLRMNYFPAWRAHYGEQAVELIDQDGQMAFIAPTDGDDVVTLIYPRYGGYSVLALVTIAVSLAISWRYKEIL